MGSGKLHMKETPAERRERELHRARKAATKAAKRAQADRDDDGLSSDGEGRKRRRKEPGHRPPPPDPWDGSDAEYGPPPPGQTGDSKPDYETLQAELEEQRWREKMWDAMDDDSMFMGSSRLDALEADMNAYAHVPKRWRGPHAGGDVSDIAGVDPNTMEDEEYAEWIRVGMWRKKNPDYYAERARKQAAEDARRAHEKAVREETKRMQREAEEENKRKRAMRDKKRTEEARERYESGWKDLLTAQDTTTAPGENVETLGFSDIPWPVSVSRKSVFSLDDLSLDSISLFLFTTLELESRSADSRSNGTKKTKKEVVREALLRFHPDKFEGRVMRRVRHQDKEQVKDGVGRVARALNELMAKVDT